jgi:hypothetical protein
MPTHAGVVIPKFMASIEAPELQILRLPALRSGRPE